MTSRAVLLGLLFLALPSLANEKEAETCIRTRIWDGYAEGWAVRTATRASLSEGEYRVYVLTLFAGTEYRFQACGDKSTVDLDIVLHDSTGGEVARDRGDSGEPEISFKPPRTDTYYIAVFNAKVGKPGARSGVAMAATYR